MISVCGCCVQDFSFQLIPPVLSTQASEYCCAHISGSWNFPLGSDGGAVVKTEDGNCYLGEWIGKQTRKMNQVIVDHIGFSSLLLIRVLVCLL